jgi:hypothetical protein
MAEETQNLIRDIVRSVDKRLDWEAIPSQNDLLRLTLRQAHGESNLDVTRSEIAAANEGGAAYYKLRERVKRAQRRIFESGRPYMPWRLPKIEPIGAPLRAGGPRPPRR